MSGSEVVTALQEIDPGVKIIISSGYSEEEATKKIGTGKISGFIQKPYTMGALLAAMKRVLG